jgi:Asp-tRNA(Asn)/Glu-tRNA(Gln) amidotransferase A subunit family amidase
VREHTESVVEMLGKAGARIEEVRLPEDLTLAHAAHRAVTFSECAALHEGLYAEHAEEMGPKLRALIELGMVTPAVSYIPGEDTKTGFLYGTALVPRSLLNDPPPGGVRH